MNPEFRTPWPAPQTHSHTGTFVSLTPTDIVADLNELFAAAGDAALWQYMNAGPFADEAAMSDWICTWQKQPDVICFTVTQRELSRRVGMLSIMRITPAHGVAELGSIWYAPAVQRTKVNTESIYLLLKHLFDDLGYRRVEWKCDSANARSRAAALRLGFQFEGIFRKHMVVKGRNRDTAWFAMLDGDWPRRKANLEQWLYSDDGVSLSELNR